MLTGLKLDTPDGNRRIVLRTLVFDEENHKLFNFFVSHFTYARGEGQMSNAFGTDFCLSALSTSS